MLAVELREFVRRAAAAALDARDHGHAWQRPSTVMTLATSRCGKRRARSVASGSVPSASGADERLEQRRELGEREAEVGDAAAVGELLEARDVEPAAVEAVRVQLGRGEQRAQQHGRDVRAAREVHASRIAAGRYVRHMNVTRR